LIQVLKHINWFGLLYFLANNGVYQVLFAKHTNQQNRQRIRMRENSRSQDQQEASRNQSSEIPERVSKQNLIFIILVISWFLHNAVSLYMLDFESSGKMIYEKIFQEHVNHIKAQSYPIQTDFIKSLLCEQSQITLALILVALCFVHKNTFWKGVFFIVIYHVIVAYRVALNEELIPVVKAETINVNHSSSYKNAEYYEDVAHINMKESNSHDELLKIEANKDFKSQSNVNNNEGYFPAHIESKEEIKENLFRNEQVAYEPEVEENNDQKDCFNRLPWLAYIPLKTISLGFEIFLDAGQIFEEIVCLII